MKPRITQIDFMGTRLWRCRGFFGDGLGRTPAEAYARWMDQWRVRVAGSPNHDIIPAMQRVWPPFVNGHPVFAPVVTTPVNPLWTIGDWPHTPTTCGPVQ